MPRLSRHRNDGPGWMFTLTDVVAVLMALVAAAGVAQAATGFLAVRRFVAAREQDAPTTSGPGVTVLKPLYGDEPMLEAALASMCTQDYAPFQLIFGVQSPSDAALRAVERVRARFPDADITVVVDDAVTGKNRKIANLVNMLPSAKHDILVIADSDVLAAPDWLGRIVTALQVPGTGLVTTLYTGLAALNTVWARLGATSITHAFLPGALLARQMGRQDCLGATMALRRDVLDRIGGLPALLPHLADDYVLGWLVRRLGLSVRLAATVPTTTVADTTPGRLFRHELRWGRTIRAMVPVELALSAIQYACAWAFLAVVLSGMAAWSIVVFLATWAGRAAVARGIDRTLAAVSPCATTPAPIWLLPLRDLLSIAVLLASYAGDRVEWRGHVMRATGVPDREMQAT